MVGLYSIMLQDLSTAEEASEKDLGFQSILFSRLSLHHPLLSDVFRTPEVKQLYLHLYPLCLVVSPVPVPAPDTVVKVLTFSFQTSFYVTVKKINESKNYSVLKVLSSLEQKPESFYSEDPSVVGKWRAVLMNYINQIGIQEYYKTIKHLGKGVSADVYLAERVSDKKQFAIKVFIKSKNTEKCLHGFINELKIMRVVNHPNIIKLYEVFVSNEFIYAVLEYLQGGNLFEELKAARRLPKDDQYTILKNLSQGVQHLRLKRIAHRDLKLQNILIRKVDDRKEYVICDFGLATWIDEESYIFQKCGTPGYIAPEILRLPKDEKLLLTNKVDIYSLGAIFHLIMLSRPTFIYQSGQVKMAIKLNKLAVIDWNQSIYNYLSEDELKMLQLMLEPNPEKRINSQALLKLDYFKKDKNMKLGHSSVKSLSDIRVETPKTENLSTMVMGSSKFLRNIDKVGTSKVKEERQTSLNRNSSLTKQIKFEKRQSQADKDKEKELERQRERQRGDKSVSKSSIFDIFRRKKGSSANNSTDILSPHKEVKSLASMSMNVTDIKPSSKERKSTFGFLFKRNTTN